MQIWKKYVIPKVNEVINMRLFRRVINRYLMAETWVRDVTGNYSIFWCQCNIVKVSDNIDQIISIKIKLLHHKFLVSLERNIFLLQSIFKFIDTLCKFWDLFLVLHWDPPKTGSCFVSFHSLIWFFATTASLLPPKWMCHVDLCWKITICNYCS